MESSNKSGIIGVLVGAGLVAIGYGIYQTYPNEITANADAIKSKLKGLFGKDKFSKKQEDCGCNKRQGTLVAQEAIVKNEDGSVDVFITEPPSSDMPFLMPSILVPSDASEQALSGLNSTLQTAVAVH